MERGGIGRAQATGPAMCRAALAARHTGAARTALVAVGRQHGGLGQRQEQSAGEFGLGARLEQVVGVGVDAVLGVVDEELLALVALQLPRQ